MSIYSKIKNFFHKKEKEVEAQPSVNAIIKSLEEKGMQPEQIVQGAEYMISVKKMMESKFEYVQSVRLKFIFE